MEGIAAEREHAQALGVKSTEERQKQEILRLGALLNSATEAAARYQAQVIQLEQKLKRVLEALR